MESVECSGAGGNETYEHRQEDRNHAESEEDRKDHGCDPVNVRQGRPGERKEAERQDNASDAAERETLLWRERDAATRDELADVALVVEYVRDDGL